MKTTCPFHTIRRLEVSGGFLHGLCLDFGEHLNCLIGARGTGKTTILELLRWSLDHMPNPAEAAEHYRRIDRLVQANLGGGQIKVVIETLHGVRYAVQKAYGQEGQVFDERGDVVQVDLGKGNIFSVEVYSQNQIEEIANDPLFQLKLIDKFVAAAVRERNGQIQALGRELASNAVDLLRLWNEITTLQEQLAELAEVTEKLKALPVDESTAEQKALQAESRAKALRDQEKRCVRKLQEFLSHYADNLGKWAREGRTQMAEAWNEAFCKGPNGKFFRELQATVTGQMQEVTDKLGQAVALVEGLQQVVRQKGEELQAAHARQEQAYQGLLAKFAKEKERTEERDQLLRRQAELLETQQRLSKRRAELQEKESARKTMLERLSELKDERFQLRQGVAQMLSEKLAPHIRVRIAPNGNTDAYRELLLEKMKGSGFKYTQVVERLIQRLPPQELAAVVQQADVQALQDQLEIDADRANRLVLQLKDSQAVFDIEVVELHDRPSIELKDGPDYKDSGSLSTGQKCTTILPILLLESASPLLIDQPEDNLDNAFIYETIVKSIKGVHGKRQLIFVTHNPNIPVLGEGRVLVMQSTGRQGRLKAAGSVDEVKGEIETLLEGGKEAFQRRKERYGY